MVFGSLGTSFWFAGGLVGAGGVEGEGAKDLASGGMDDAEVQVFDEPDKER